MAPVALLLLTPLVSRLVAATLEATLPSAAAATNSPDFAACTTVGEDPSGEKIPCCKSLTPVVKDWDGAGHFYYKCMAAKPPSPTPGDGHGVAKWLNSLYSGFQAQDDLSPLGVTISMQNRWAFYCKDVGGSCYKGHADCRLSASLYNHKMMLDRKSNGIKITMSRVAGIVLNQTLVERKFGKCSYMFDGATFNRYNGACGCTSSSEDCNNPHSAFGNVCPSTGQTCQMLDTEVARCSCEAMPEPSRSDVPQCYWPGTVLDTSAPRPDQTRSMVLARLRHQDGVDSSDRLEYWNEVVIDEHVLLQQLQHDPVPAIPAFIYVKGNHAGVAFAKQMRDDYVKQFDVSVEIPLIGVDPTVNVDSALGPFSYDDSVAEHAAVV